MMQRLKNKMGSYFRRIRNSITIHVLCYDTFRCLSTGSFIKKHKIMPAVVAKEAIPIRVIDFFAESGYTK